MKSYSILFGYCNRAQGWAKWPQSAMRPQPWPPRKAIENHRISSLSPWHQKAIKIYSKTSQKNENATEINRIPTCVNSFFCCNTSNTKYSTMEPLASRSRPLTHKKLPVSTHNKNTFRLPKWSTNLKIRSRKSTQIQ